MYRKSVNKKKSIISPIILNIIFFICLKWQWLKNNIICIYYLYNIKRNVTKIINNTQAKIIYISIPPPSSIMMECSPNIRGEILRCNKVFEEIAEEYYQSIVVLNPFSDIEDVDKLYSDDGYNFSDYCIELVHSNIKNKLEEIKLNNI